VQPSSLVEANKAAGRRERPSELMFAVWPTQRAQFAARWRRSPDLNCIIRRCRASSRPSAVERNLLDGPVVAPQHSGFPPRRRVQEDDLPAGSRPSRSVALFRPLSEDSPRSLYAGVSLKSLCQTYRPNGRAACRIRAESGRGDVCACRSRGGDRSEAVRPRWLAGF